jgi:hypothetical protein
VQVQQNFDSLNPTQQQEALFFELISSTTTTMAQQHVEESFLSPVSPFSSLSPFSYEKQSKEQVNNFFSETFATTSALNSLLSPLSPPKLSPKFSLTPNIASSVMNGGDLDQAFAQLISDTPSASIQDFIPSNNQPLYDLLTTTPSPTSTKSAKLKPPPLKIPQMTSLPAAVAKQSQATVQQQSFAVSGEEDRKWHTVFVDPTLSGSLQVEVTSKTRCEEPSDEIPDKLYSSLKYEIRQQVSGKLCSEIPFLLARITVVDAVDFKEILKDKKSVLKGVVEGSCVKPPTASEPRLEGTLKVQFTDVSYHHKKRGFCFQISYFTPGNLDNAVLIKRSASFLVYARKPSQGKKRKHSEVVADSYEFFSARLDELVQCSKKLKPNERRQALEMVSARLLQLDPAYFCEQLRMLQQEKKE